MDDVISRKAAIDALRKRMDKSAKGEIGSFYNTVIIRNIEILESLPPAQLKHDISKANFLCPICGAEMEVAVSGWEGK